MEEQKIKEFVVNTQKEEIAEKGKKESFIKDIGKLPDGYNEQGNVKMQESIKLIKNTKGYNWEVKILSDRFRHNPEDDLDLERLELINDYLKSKFEGETKKD